MGRRAGACFGSCRPTMTLPSSSWICLVVVVCTTSASWDSHQWEAKSAEDYLKVVEDPKSGPWIKERYRKKLGMEEYKDGVVVTKTAAAVAMLKLKDKATCIQKDKSAACAAKLLLCGSDQFGPAADKECPVTCAVGLCGTKRVFNYCKTRTAIINIKGAVDTGTGAVATTALPAGQGNLLSKTAWVPKSSAKDVLSYLEVALSGPELVVGISIQGPYDVGLHTTGKISNKTGWVEQYKMQYWGKSAGGGGADGWQDMVGEGGHGGSLLFPGNYDPETVVHSYLYKPLQTSKLKFLPVSVHNFQASMRVGIQVCDPRTLPAPVVVKPEKKKIVVKSSADKAAAIAAAKEGVEKQKLKAANDAKNVERVNWVSHQLQRTGARDKLVTMTPAQVAKAADIVLPQPKTDSKPKSTDIDPKTKLDK